MIQIVAGVPAVGALWPFRAKGSPETSDGSARPGAVSPEQIVREFGARIVFDSNRSGSFGIYSMAADGTDVRPLVDTGKHEIYPDPSPDGSLIAFARAESLERTAPAQICLIDRNGENERVIAENGTFPTFSSDGRTVFFERNRSRVIAVDIAGGEEQELFPADSEEFENYKVIKPRVSADRQRVFFTSDRRGRWNAWYADISSGASYHLGAGCEPVPFADGSTAAWITKSGPLGRSTLNSFDVSSGRRTVLRSPGTRVHQYFPSITAGDAYLLFSACRQFRHSHLEANYEIFIRDIHRQAVVQVSRDGFTNRWPKRLP